jgi:cytochrome c oxidase subunit 2
MHNSNALDPQSPQARAIYDLGIVSTIVFVLIFAAVAAAVIYSLVRFRWREGDAEPHQFAGHKKTELIWTAIPLVIVLVLFGLTWRTMSAVDPPPPPAPDLVVTGHQFWWEARYPGSGAVVANEVHIPIGKPFSVRLEARDVLHEFWVPNLTRKMTTVPGQPNHIWLQADKPGTYMGVCSEFCGTQHAWMRFLVVAEEPEKFAAWQNAQLQPAVATAGNDAAAKGLALFRGMNCINCHAVGGVEGATARVAPDLTHIASRRQLGAGIMDNTPENLRRWMKDPQEVKPGIFMPNYNFSDEQLDQLGAFFQTLR